MIILLIKKYYLLFCEIIEHTEKMLQKALARDARPLISQDGYKFYLSIK